MSPFLEAGNGPCSGSPLQEETPELDTQWYLQRCGTPGTFEQQEAYLRGIAWDRNNYHWHHVEPCLGCPLPLVRSQWEHIFNPSHIISTHPQPYSESIQNPLTIDTALLTMNYSEGEPIVGVNSQPEYELPDVSLADNSSYPSQEFPSLPANLNDSLSSADNWISHEILEDYQVRGLYAGFQREIDEQLDTLFKDLVNYPEVEDSNNVDTEVPDGGDLAPHQNTAIHTSQDEPFNYEEWMAI